MKVDELYQIVSESFNKSRNRVFENRRIHPYLHNFHFKAGNRVFVASVPFEYLMDKESFLGVILNSLLYVDKEGHVSGGFIDIDSDNDIVWGYFDSLKYEIVWMGKL